LSPTSSQQRQRARSTAGNIKAAGDAGAGESRVAHPPGETTSLFTGGGDHAARPTRALRSASLPARDWELVFRRGGGGASHGLTRKGGGRSCTGRRSRRLLSAPPPSSHLAGGASRRCCETGAKIACLTLTASPRAACLCDASDVKGFHTLPETARDCAHRATTELSTTMENSVVPAMRPS
jgi:hypothetical protein